MSSNELENKIKEVAKQYLGKPIALSSGIDSGLLAALIKPKFAITVELPEGKHNEIKEASLVAKYLGIEHIIVKCDESKFDEYTGIAVKAIGRPIPHFNIFPLFCMYKKLNELEVKEIVLGDGPDETMCGYARDLIINYLYKIYDFEAFKNYKPIINEILPPYPMAISGILNKPILDMGNASDTILNADIELMRPDMDDMSNRIAKYFGIVNHRPYQDNTDLDDFMRDMPVDDKILEVQYGKYPLREIAEKYLPYEIAWRKEKVGGPVYPVNTLKGWLETDREFGKTSWINYQKKILENKDE